MFHGKAYANNDTGALKHSYLLVQTKGKYQFETDIPSHVKHTLALVANRYLVAILKIEILGKVQMISISYVGQISTVQIKRTNNIAILAVYDICSESGIK